MTEVLSNYTALHHVLRVACSKYPQLRRTANRRVEKFMESKANRHFNVTPNLGFFLINVLVSDYKWSDVAEVRVCTPYLSAPSP